MEEAQDAKGLRPYRLIEQEACQEVRHPWPEWMRERARGLRGEGWSWAEIGKELGVGRSTVRYWVCGARRDWVKAWQSSEKGVAVRAANAERRRYRKKVVRVAYEIARDEGIDVNDVLRRMRDAAQGGQ